MLNFAIFGCGRIGKMHAENLFRHRDCSVSALYDVYHPAAVETAELYGGKVVETVEEALADDTINAVLIASSTDTHADLIEVSAAAGKAILCEKPIDLSLDRVNRCADAIKAYDVPLQIGFNRRFDPGHSGARDALLAGQIGELHQVIITSRDPDLPPKGYLQVAGGLLRDMSIHDFDMARFYLPDEPVEVFAVANALIDPALGAELDEVDCAMVILRTASGKMCHINNHRKAAYGYDQRVELMGSTGMLISDNRKPHEVRHYGEDSSEASEPYLRFFIERYHEAYVAEIDAFVRAVKDGTPVQASFDDGQKALVLAEAAYKSIAEKRMVRVDEIG